MKSILTRTDQHSEVFQKLKKHYEAKLDLARRRNDNDLEERETAKLRGRIAEINEFLALANPVPQPVNDVRDIVKL